MNKRIRELAKQAGILTEVWHKDSLGNGYKVPNFEAEKFAELIVKECADLCDRFQARDVGMQPAECAGAIRKMFGVE